MANIADQLCEMGFERAAAERAQACNDNLDQAIEWLLAHADEIVAEEVSVPSSHISTPSSNPIVTTTSVDRSVAEGEGAQSGGETRIEDKGGVATASGATEEPMQVDTSASTEASGAVTAESSKTDELKTASESSGQADDATPTVNSYKCDDCGKLLKDETAVEWHASKTNHANYSQSEEVIKPLSAEEKQKQAELLRQKIKAAMSDKEEKERKEAIEKERARREEGKKVAEMKDDLARKEMLKIAEDRKREKAEAEAARKKILEEIARDRAERAAAASGVKPPEPKPEKVAPPPVRNYDETIIQFRLLDGSTVKQTFGAKESLAAVRAWLMTHHLPSVEFKLLTPFPRKVFANEDYDAPLHSLGLVPNASLVVTQSQ